MAGRTITVYTAVIPNDYRYAVVETFATKQEAEEFLREENRNGVEVCNATMSLWLSECAFSGVCRALRNFNGIRTAQAEMRRGSSFCH